MELEGGGLFKQDNHHTPSNEFINTLETGAMKILGPTWGRGFVFGINHGKLHMIYIICQQNQSGMYCRYSGFLPDHDKIPVISNQ